MRSHDLDVRGARLRVHESGDPDGPVLVLQHGWPQTASAWDRIAPGLAADGYRVLCPDLRGFGDSEATENGYRKDELTHDLLGILDALEVEQASIAGHDWGGWIAFLAALEAPSRIDRVVAIAIAHPWASPDPRIVLDAWRFTYAAAVSLPVVGPRFTQHVVSRMRDDARQLRDLDRARATQHLYRSLVEERFEGMLRGGGPGELPVPGLYVHAEKDAVVTSRVASGWEAAGPNLRFEQIKGAGHFVLDEHPDEVLALLRGFLAPVPVPA